ncbi:tetratricopeptide repeat protein [Oceaniglobus indicus]|uniref:tetratricopeptide repeat protein n=1 Tax=Oceaniglobus indicus TaxID=2047749 RepID=UPI0011AB36A8|nr:tetratricopeptide repeat protein [Oceaniglobus indicus]
MQYLKCAVAAFAITIFAALPLRAQQGDLDALFETLKAADADAAPAIVDRIWTEWSKSGSPAMDLLLKRGRDSMEAEEFAKAADHFGALIDHAPHFAEGYNARATAYFRLGRYGLSLADIRSALALNPRHFGAMAGLASIQEELGFQTDALATWRRVLDINPNDEHAAQAVLRLGTLADGVQI